MRDDRPATLPPRGSPPPLNPSTQGHTDVLRVVRARRRRQALMLGLSTVLVVGLTVSLNVRGGHVSTLQPATPTQPVDDDTDTRTDLLLGPPASPSPGAVDGAGRPASGKATVAVDPTEQALTSARGGIHPSAPVARSKGRSDLPRGCGGVGTVAWCLRANVTPVRSGDYELSSQMCVNANAGRGDLDFATTHEAEFELLAGSRVIWRWSDTQTFARQPHQISALVGECFTWVTHWDQYDGGGSRVGKARLTLRVRHLATQPSNPEAAVMAFFTVP